MMKNITFLTHLQNRSIISFKHKDIYQVIQGITTNDLREIQQSQSTVFLQTNGRVFCEAILHRPQIQHNNIWEKLNDEIWIDVDTQIKDQLINYVKKYMIRKSVEINDFTKQLNVYQTYVKKTKDILLQSDDMEHEEDVGQEIDDNELSEEGDYKTLISVDPRLSSLGIRVISNSIPEIDENMVKLENQLNYDLFRIQQGVLEGKEVQNKIPFLVNLDFWNSINLKKGCYVGQELTARSYLTGVIRKRMIPYKIISNDNDQNLVDTEIMNNDQSIGKIVICKGNIGMAIINYLEYDLNKEYKVGNKTLQFILKDTFKQKLKEYVEMIQARQV